MTKEELAIWAKKVIGSGKNEAREIDFVKVDTDETKANILALYEAVTGRSLARADPVRLFLEVMTYIVILLKAAINYTGKMNLLKYAVQNYLDEIGVLVGTERLPATAATTTLKITLSATRTQNTVIPKGTRVTADSKQFFATSGTVVIPMGKLSAVVSAECLQTGTEGNGYAVGEIREIVDSVPFVSSIVNITTSEGGSDTEDDKSLRDRIHQAPESFSCAGPDGAYRYHAMRASALIVDVSVTSPRPTEVEIRPLLANGEIPGEEILKAVRDVLNDRKIRPLTDKVSVLPPEIKNYDVTLTYWIRREDAPNAAAIQTAIDTAVDEYIAWQKAKLGRDINPSELIYRIRMAGAKRVEVMDPVFTIVMDAEMAVAQSVKVTFGGLEDE